jgi:hypothetical protein
MANDLDDLDEGEGGPQPAQGRELVIVDLRHNHRSAALAGVTQDSISIWERYDPGASLPRGRSPDRAARG